MKYKVTHTTIYNYTEPVPICHNEVHLTPRDHRRQTCLSHRCAFGPEPARIDTRVDYFGNHAGSFSIQEGHDRLSVTAHSQVQVVAPEIPDPPTTPAWEEIRDRFALGQPPWWLEARQFVYASPHVPIHDELASLCPAIVPAGRPWLAARARPDAANLQGIQVRPGGHDGQHAGRDSVQAIAAASARTSPTCRLPASVRSACRPATSAATCSPRLPPASRGWSAPMRRTPGCRRFARKSAGSTVAAVASVASPARRRPASFRFSSRSITGRGGVG